MDIPFGAFAVPGQELFCGAHKSCTKFDKYAETSLYGLCLNRIRKILHTLRTKPTSHNHVFPVGLRSQATNIHMDIACYNTVQP